jgi:hypothetical protein
MWQKISQYGDEIPYPRTSHTCVTYKNRYLVVIGGETETKNIVQIKDDSSKSDQNEAQSTHQPKNPKERHTLTEPDSDVDMKE